MTSSWGGSRYAPNVFTEQGVYMLMTILKGELAAKQSRDLVRTFKKMKDYILGNQTLIGQREVMRLSMQTAENTTSISKLRADIGSVERQMSDVMEQLGDVVTKSELADMMNSFVSDEDNGWLLYNTKYCSSDVAYSSIYGQAKKSVWGSMSYCISAGANIIIFFDFLPASRIFTPANSTKISPEVSAICKYLWAERII